MNRMLEERGAPAHPIEMYRQFIGDGMRMLVERALPMGERSPQQVDEAVNLYQECYAEGWHGKTVVYPQMHEVLTRLVEEGLPVGVISNKPQHFTELCVKHFFPEVAFTVVLGQRDSVPRKPAPEAALEAAVLMGVRTAECAYVGDSGVDMQFARAAGMRAIGVSWGFRPVEELWDAGAGTIVENAEGLLGRVMG